jgi:hypothetical protein
MIVEQHQVATYRADGDDLDLKCVSQIL